jgi:hypothetical protein
MQSANCKLRLEWTHFAAALLLCALAASARAAEPSADFELQTIRGRVVYLAEALEKRGVTSVPEAKERVLALESREGELVPVLEDVRGRAFRRDERLRKMEIELLVRRYEGSPVVQIIRVFEVAKDGLYEIDYWCEICAIAMYELKDCECCQGPIELRKRKSAGK